MRTKQTIINSIVGVTCSIFSMLLGFLSRAVFVRILNAEYLGISGLFSNILSVLNIAELGIGSAIIFHLYRPVAEKDHAKINTLLRFYRRAYLIIAAVVLVFGLLLLPFLPFFIGEMQTDLNLRLIYLLFLGGSVSSYLLSYRNSIFTADQKNYAITLKQAFAKLLLFVLQVTALLLTKNYYLYLALNLLTQLFCDLAFHLYSAHRYPFLRARKVKKLDKTTRREIFTQIRAVFLHKIGSFIVLGTDNIIISKFINVATVGLYSNYFLVINAVQSIFGQIIGSSTASVGNLLVSESRAKNFTVFRRIRFLNFWLATFGAVSILCMMQPFIRFWVGADFLLPLGVLVALTVNFYMQTTRSAYMAFKTAAGIWVEDRFVPLIESVLNIVASVILVKIYGLAGVFIGTVISSLALWCYSYPRFVYKKLFHASYTAYIKETLGFFGLFALLSAGSFVTLSFIRLPDAFAQFAVNALFCLVVPNLVLFLVFRNNPNLKFYLALAKNLFHKKHLCADLPHTDEN